MGCGFVDPNSAATVTAVQAQVAKQGFWRDGVGVEISASIFIASHHNINGVRFFTAVDITIWLREDVNVFLSLAEYEVWELVASYFVFRLCSLPLCPSADLARVILGLTSSTKLSVVKCRTSHINATLSFELSNIRKEREYNNSPPTVMLTEWRQSPVLFLTYSTRHR